MKKYRNNKFSGSWYHKEYPELAANNCYLVSCYTDDVEEEVLIKKTVIVKHVVLS